MRLPKIEDCQFNIVAEQDDIPVRGNALASGDNALDKRCEDAILKRLDNGDIWAWACVKVECVWKGWKGVDYLGGCSYTDETDFCHPGGYYPDMKERAFEDMIKEIERKTAPLLIDA